MEKTVSPIRPSTEPRILSRGDLDHVIDSKLSREEAAQYLARIRIDDYSVPDPNTNWTYASIGGGLSVYFFSYRARFFILLLVDGQDGVSSCADIVVIVRPTAEYELGMGPVEIDNDHLDGEVIVVHSRKWKGNYTDDIIAAYKPNAQTKRLDAAEYRSIRIYREG